MIFNIYLIEVYSLKFYFEIIFLNNMLIID